MKKDFETIFELLDEWRLLPNYQLERRADIFFAIYLEKIIQSHFNNFKKVIIIPEFPVRRKILGFDDAPNKSKKIDYLMIGNTQNFLIELKTDNNSITKIQRNYLEKAKNIGLSKLISGVIEISKKSRSKKKYIHLINKLEVAKEYLNNELEVVYILPKKSDKLTNEIQITFNEIIEILKFDDSFLAKRFAESLKKWSLSLNK